MAALKVSVIAYPDDHSGHGCHSAQVIRHLPALLNCEVIVRPTRAGRFPDDIQALCQSGENDAGIEIILGPPKIQPTKGKRTLYLTTVESTRPPEKTIQILNAAEVVVVPSQWCATVLSARGVTRPIYVVPLGVSEAFDYRPAPKHGSFTFACAGQLSNGRTRKGIDQVIDCFQRAFKPEENVRLKVKLALGESVGSAPGIDVTAARLSESEVADWLAECHCFINLATEGYGCWPAQACAMGRTVISPLFGGVADFLNHRNSFIVKHRLVPAGDSWTGQGLWAKADDDDVITAMRRARANEYFLTRDLGAAASLGGKSWKSSIAQLAEIIQSLTPQPHKPAAEIAGSTDPMDDVTVCVTSFKRGEYLRRALQSVVAAGFTRAAVFSMEPNAGVFSSLMKSAETYGLESFVVETMREDLGCNSLWERAAYLATTPYVIILHDDDLLLPELGQKMPEIVQRLREGYCVTWRGAHLWPDGRVTPTEYCPPYGHSSSIEELEKLLLKRGGLSLSPIVTVFQRDTLIHALKEADKFLTAPQCYLRPAMLLGTEILAHLRQQQGKKGWLFAPKVLSHYGVHDGSGTYTAEKSGDISKLVAGYDYVRSYYEANKDRKIDYPPKLLLLSSPFTPKDEDAKRRIENARWTWERHFELGRVLDFPVLTPKLPRSSRDIDDAAELPYLRDLLDYGCAHAMGEDAVVYANLDLALTADADREILDCLKRSGGVCVAWRRSMPVPVKRMIASAKNGKIDGGVDLIAVTPKWWREHRENVPDMFIGSTWFDYVFRVYAERATGGKCYTDTCTYHEFHEALQGKLNGSPRQIHNHKLAAEFFRSIGDTNAVAGLMKEEPL